MDKKINMHKISDRTGNAHLPFWFLNAVKNYEQIKNALNDEKAFCLGKAGGAFLRVPAVVIGSGPTLIPSLPYLKTWKEQTGGNIFCGLSNINILLNAGIKPDFLCIYDHRDKHNDKDFDLASSPEGYYKDIPMITSPEYDHDFIKFWLGLGNKIYFHMRGTGSGDDKVYYTYLQTLLPMVYVLNPDIKNPIKSGIMNVGCVANHELVAAAMMGHDPIYLCGVNFGYPMDTAHVHPLIFKGGEWVESGYNWDNPDAEKARYVGDNGCLTDIVHTFYKMALIITWARMSAQVYELTIEGLYGAIDLVPKVALEELVEGDPLHEYISGSKREKIVNNYRERHGYKPIPWGPGEVQIPREDDGVDDTGMEEKIGGGIMPEIKSPERAMEAEPKKSKKKKTN